ncbi:nucleoside phosphorylase [Edaphobacter modestus]|uniref:Adenosylhomocysteine nucleosidase n=1 Tax=Edaphobacter modestus TaxID=388466 RepID=A0A4Q7YQW0_9BACT|nr:nucleoside phosphorylase [Edaphobacter modestus]RZU39209.1 adenosylhomocysteine nucleosidase [Edaphobacter modestus]
MRVGIIAALPGELKPLVRNWERYRSGVKGLSVWRTTREEDELIAVCGGMGANAALRAFTAAEFLGALDLVLSVGWAGALAPEMKTGDCYIPSEVIDAQTGERFLLTEGKRKLRLVTTPRVADTEEKRRLSESYGAALVDMEAATVARLAQIRGVPFCCFKAVSDAPDAKLPDLNGVIDTQGQMQMLPFLAYVAVRPGFWGSLLELGKNSSVAARAIAENVNRFLMEKDVERTNQTGAV